MLGFEEEPIDECICVCGGGGYCRLWPCAHPVLYLHLNEAGKVIYWQGVWAAVSRSLSLSLTSESKRH